MTTDLSMRAALEALLTVSETPLSIVTLAGALEAPINEVRKEIEALQADYDSAHEGQGRGFELREVGGGWRLYVRQTHDWGVRQLVANENPAKLSQAALETLSVIAYRQPISRGQISSIRGVNVDSVVRTLISRGLVVELFQDQDSGASMFGTTDLLLEQLGINSLEELPAISPHLPDQDNID
ncbi:MAG: SMC-Scp complex subunit ScpB [Aquiluna sp.]|jgi:segregation and condensation protein B|nr:SMC-Scp complex subunit ScpB [Aquiluna sp.]NCV35294.1 SMC-Scp complex subunit ScpB [Actinomycetota bacterium]NCV36500.1 SMC-Scp complex subunit ScpB [Actinomycetota bacterium]NCV80511.1 SMC-Scp complex subunit ScpB [Actinomycetota bacterium]NCV98043.1 SMC-Scp complex subunit ScpB [Actinomycetota bacterium]